jgi:uncharacterized protein
MKLKTLLVACMVVVLGLFPLLLKAIELDTLYSADIPVTSQDAAERQQAITQAVQEVLVKVSGNSAIATAAVLSSSLSNASAYVQSYTYEDSNTTDEPSADKPPTLILKVKFNPRRIKSLLAKVDQDVWTGNRPLILVWMALENSQGRQLVGNDTRNELLEQLKKHAARRGIPLMFPQMDLDDLNSVSVKDIWNLNPSLLKKENKRYQSDGILIGRVTEQNGHWQVLGRYI